MPIHECTLEGGGKGFQWGSGKCYPTRAQAEKQAQAAYANGYTGDEVTHDGPSGIEPFLPVRTLLTDSFIMDGIHRSKDGYLAAYANVARTGIQVYKGRELGRPDLGDVRVYRSPEEVFNKDAMKSMAHRPVTMPHPSETVNAKNWKKYAKGHTGDEVIRDGDHVRISMVVMDSDAINAIESGDSKELSMGYSTDLKWTPGKTSDGQEYDAVQTEIRANHLAIVPVARGGKNLRFGDAETNLHDATCPHCGAQVPNDADECPTCGADMDIDYEQDDDYNDSVEDSIELEDEHLDDYNQNHDPRTGKFAPSSGGVSSQPKRPRGRPRKDQSQRPQATHSSSAPEAPKIPENEQDLRAAGYRFHENKSPGHPALGSHYVYHDQKGFSSGPQPSRAHAVASAVEHATGEMAPEIEAHRMALAQHELEKQQHQSLVPYESGSVPHFLEQSKIYSPKNIAIKAFKQGNNVFKTQEEAYKTIIANRAHWNRATVTSTDLTETKPYRVPKILGGEAVGYWLKNRDYAKKEQKKFYKISHDALVDLTLEDSIVEIDDDFDPNQPRDDRGRWTKEYLESKGYQFGKEHNVGYDITNKNFVGKNFWSEKTKNWDWDKALNAASVHHASVNKLLSPEEVERLREYKILEDPLLNVSEHQQKFSYGSSTEVKIDPNQRWNPPKPDITIANPAPMDLSIFSQPKPQVHVTQAQPFTFTPLLTSFGQNTSSYSGGPKVQSINKDELEAYIKQQREFWKKARIKTHVDVTHSTERVEPGFFRRAFNIEKTRPVTTKRTYYSIGHDGAVVDAETDDVVIHNIDQGENDMSKMITIDGVPVETTDVGAAVVQRYIEKLSGDVKALQDAKKKDDDGDAEKDKAMDGLKKQIETKDGEILALKKQLVDAQAAANPERLDALVKDRSMIIDSARLILDASFVFDGKKSEDIRRAAVSSKLGDATVKEMTDAAIEGAFKALTVDAKKQGGGTRPIARALFDQQSNSPVGDMRDAAFAENEKYLNNAWKTPAVRN